MTFKSSLEYDGSRNQKAVWSAEGKKENFNKTTEPLVYKSTAYEGSFDSV